MSLQLRGSRSVATIKILMPVIALTAFVCQPFGVISLVNALSGSVHSTNLNNWTTTETRSNGRNELVADGLRVYTLASDSESKAAGYYGYVTNDINFDLENASDFNLTWNGTTPAPGGQLVVDLDNDGDLDGILVVENAYGGIGGNLWNPSIWGQSTGTSIDTTKYPTAGGGGGSRNGSLSDWNIAFPNAKVRAIGYSLGSGVKGDGIISSITVNSTAYTFGLPPVVAPTVSVTSPAQNGATRTNVANTLRVAGSFKDDKAVNYLQLELVKDGNLVTVYTMHYNNPGLNAGGNFAVDMPVPANLNSGQYSLYYTGTDFDGGVSARMLRNFTIDNTSPTTTLVAPTGVVGNTFKISGVAGDNFALNRAYVQLVNRQNSQRYGGTTLYLSGTSQSWERIFDATALSLPDGKYAAHVAVTDNVGNTVSEGWSDDFTVDKTAPGAPTLTVNDYTTGSLTNKPSATAKWNNTATDTIRYEYNYWNDITGNPYKETSPYVVDTTGLSYAGAFNQGDGTHYMRVRAIDAVGNTSQWSNVFVVRFDSTAPVISTNVANGQVISGATTLKMNTIESNPKIYNIRVLDSTGNIVKIGNQNAGAYDPNNASNSFSYIFDTTKVSNGTYSIQFSARDAADNAAATVVRTVNVNNPLSVVDTTPPIQGSGPTTNTNLNTGTNSTPAGIANQPISQPSASLPAGDNTVDQGTLTPATSQDAGSGTTELAANDDDILGTSTTEQDKDGEVAGASDSAGWSLGALAWYWWIVIALSAMGLWLIIAAASRRIRGADA